MSHPPETAAPEEKRQYQRRKVSLPARLRWSAAELPARIRNISRMGAMIETDTPLPQDAQVVLLCHEAERRARVVWSRDGMIGLLFRRPFGEQQLERFLAAPGAASRKG